MNAPLTKQQRANMASCIIEAQRDHWGAHGEAENADWADGERYLRDDADDAELRASYTKWVLTRKHNA